MNTVTAALATLAVLTATVALPQVAGPGRTPLLLSVRQHTHGPCKVTQIVESDGPFVDPAVFYAGIGLDEVRKACPPGAAGHIADDGKLVFATQIFLVQRPGLNVLIDMGSGNDKERPEQPWWHHQKLASLGLTPDDVHFVFFTHLHDDHVGFATTLRNGRWVPAFPKARYVASKIDWDYFASLPKATRHPSFDDSVLPLANAGVLDLVRDGERRAGLRAHLSPAHTPGLVLYELEGTNVWFVGDLLHHPAQFVRPEWKSASYDFDPAAVGAERRKQYGRLADANAVLYAAHIGQPYRVLREGESGFTGRICR